MTEREAEATAFNLHQIATVPVSAKQLAGATAVDPELSKVVRYS